MSVTKNKIVLKKLKELDTIWHPESGLVFKSATDKVVISRWVNEENIPLDDEAIELCEKWKFKYDTSVFGEEEGEEEGGEEEQEEGGEEEQEAEEQDSEEPVQVPTQTQVPTPVQVTKVDDTEFQNITSNLVKYFDNLNTNYLGQISQLKSELLNKTNECADMTNKYNDMTNQYNDMKEQYEKLKAKFDGIKSLFA